MPKSDLQSIPANPIPKTSCGCLFFLFQLEIQSTISIFHWTVDIIRIYMQGTETYLPLILIPQIRSKNP